MKKTVARGGQSEQSSWRAAVTGVWWGRGSRLDIQSSGCGGQCIGGHLLEDREPDQLAGDERKDKQKNKQTIMKNTIKINNSFHAVFKIRVQTKLP